MTPHTSEDVAAFLRSELPERKRRNLYDHPEVEGIDVLDDSGLRLLRGCPGLNTRARLRTQGNHRDAEEELVPDEVVEGSPEA